jgi:hypothetical protein
MSPSYLDQLYHALITSVQGSVLHYTIPPVINIRVINL